MTHPIVSELVARFDPDLKEAWEERAAILQFDAGYSRDQAEALAVIVLLRQHPDRICAFAKPGDAQQSPPYVKASLPPTPKEPP